jgi:hypothetical protein
LTGTGTDRSPQSYAGEVVYLYAYDAAYEIRQPPPQLVGSPGRHFSMGVTRRMPRDPFFYRPWTYELPVLQRQGPRGPLAIRMTVKLFAVGAFSIAVHVPFEVAALEDLVAYHDLQLADGPLSAEVRRTAERVFTELRPYCQRPVSELKEDEAYTVFCLRSPLPGAAPGATAAKQPCDPAQASGAMAAQQPCDSELSPGASTGAAHPWHPAAPPSAEAWLLANRRQVAALLTQEEDQESLSLQEAVESTNLYLSYYETDLAVIDWDAALLVDEPEDFDEFLHVAELANVQLIELGVFDHILDDAVDRAYHDLRRSPRDRARRGRAATPGGAPAAAAAPNSVAFPIRPHRRWRGRDDVRRDLGEIRIDLERLHDELFNITKFFGDWHLARVYQHLSARFHLEEWSRTIEGKLRTLNEFYQILKADQNNRLMVFLEVLIVVLFVIDLVILVMSLK